MAIKAILRPYMQKTEANPCLPLNRAILKEHMRPKEVAGK